MDTRLTPLAVGRPERYLVRASSRCDSVVAVAPASALHAADRSATRPNAGWPTVHARRHREEVCSLSGGVMLQPLSDLLPVGIRLLPDPIPAAPSARLAAHVPLREDYGLTTFH